MDNPPIYVWLAVPKGHGNPHHYFMGIGKIGDGF
jgi:hypothetical protein